MANNGDGALDSPVQRPDRRLACHATVVADKAKATAAARLALHHDASAAGREGREEMEWERIDVTELIGAGQRATCI